MSTQKIAVIGIGMVGTPVARYFEELRGLKIGESLFLFDTDPAKNFNDDINRADIVFISVPTPPGKEGAADLSALDSAFQKLEGNKIVVIKSTVTPGTTENFQKKYPNHKVLFNPEFLTAKRAWEDFIKPDRQIVGFTDESKDAAYPVLNLLPKAPFMSPWGINTNRWIQIRAIEAEMIKYASNVHYARKVNFANVMASLAQKLGADYENVRLAMGADFRIGDSHIDVAHGGYRGFGGHCLPKDILSLTAALEKNGLPEAAKLLKADYEYNEGLLRGQGLTWDDVRKK